MRKKNDILLKAAFEEAFPDLLRFFFKDADSIFDMARGFVFMDKELNELFPELEKQGGSRFVDMLVKIWSVTGNEEWMLIHLEIQEKNDNNFSKRMFQYFYRIYDRYDVPIAALAVFTGNRLAKVENKFEYIFLDTVLHYQYKAYHILEHTEEELLAMKNPFALIVLAAQKVLLAHKLPDTELGEQRLMIARALITSKQYDNEQIKRFLYFLKTFLHIENPSINNNFDRQIESLTQKESVMGIIETIKMLEREEGFEIGMEKGMEIGIEQESERKSREVVTNLLQANQFTITTIANFASVTEAFVEKVKKDLNL